MRTLPAILAGLLAIAPLPLHGLTTSQTTAAVIPAPAGWDKTRGQIRDSMLAGNYQEALSIAEKAVAGSPRFPDAHFWLGSVNENMARDLARSDPRRSRTRFETAAEQFRRVWELGGGTEIDAVIRGLIDLYEYALPNPDVWKTTVQDAVRRFPSQPAAHWYHVQLILRENRTSDLDAAFRSARAGMPGDPPDARLEFAGLLLPLAQKGATAADRAKLLSEVRAIAGDTLKSHPTDRYGRRARSLQEEIARIQEG